MSCWICRGMEYDRLEYKRETLRLIQYHFHANLVNEVTNGHTFGINLTTTFEKGQQRGVTGLYIQNMTVFLDFLPK